jgi:hypothetical protein
VAAGGRQEFAGFLARQLESHTAAAERNLEHAKVEVAELSQRLVGLERKVRVSSGRLAELRGTEDVDRFAGEQFDQLSALPRVAGLEFAGSTLTVDTEPFQIEWESRRYQLGEYRVTVDLQGDLRIDSLSHLGPKAGWDHPHVQAGLPCLGNLRSGVLKLIAEFELALAVQLLLDFLAIYQPETAYTPIEGWPAA